MFQSRLALVIAISFSFVLILGGVMYWGSEQVTEQFQRSQDAYRTFEQYERLSQEAYRYFKQRMDRLITETSISKSEMNISKNRLFAAMQALRNEVVKKTTFGSENQSQDKSRELERVANLTAFLDASEYRFNEVENIRKQGQVDLAREALTKYSEEEIDVKFQPLIDAAIASERKKAAEAKSELENLVDQSRWFAILASVTAAIFSLFAGAILLDRVKNPIKALMIGTDEIASGNLSYRIELNSHDEFAYLASHFNHMAQKLDIQQQKLHQNQSELEFRVAKRTFRLQELNQELKRMDAERLELLADISHELRTPITVIRGEAEVTLRGQERNVADYRDALHRITELAIQLAKYVNDLLFLAQNDTAALQFEWEILHLNSLIASSIEDFKMMAQENALSLKYENIDQPVWVQGDKQRLRQILFILGENACRYSNFGGQIFIKTWLDENQVNISLTDQGIGIPSQDLKHIFKRHFRSENARQSRKDGSGLGLPLAKSIIKAHGGNISVESTENAGSTFTISLPFLSADEEEDQINE